MKKVIREDKRIRKCKKDYILKTFSLKTETKSI